MPAQSLWLGDCNFKIISLIHDLVGFLYLNAMVMQYNFYKWIFETFFNIYGLLNFIVFIFLFKVFIVQCAMMCSLNLCWQKNKKQKTKKETFVDPAMLWNVSHRFWKWQRVPACCHRNWDWADKLAKSGLTCRLQWVPVRLYMNYTVYIHVHLLNKIGYLQWWIMSKQHLYWILFWLT